MRALFCQLCAHYAHISRLCIIHNWHWTMKRTFKINSRYNWRWIRQTFMFQESKLQQQNSSYVRTWALGRGVQIPVQKLHNMRNVFAANRVLCVASNWLYFENKRSASALVVTEKCTSLPAACCQQLVSKNNKPATGNILWILRKTVFVLECRVHSKL